LNFPYALIVCGDPVGVRSGARMRRPIFEHFAFEPWLQQLKKVEESLLD
jgi:hypothetical protein